MKKLLVVILAAALCVGMLAGCASKPAETSTPETSPPTTTTTETSTATTTETTETSTEPAGPVELKAFSVLAADVFTTYYSAAESMEEFYAWQAFRALEEAKGIDLNVEWINYDQYNTTLQTRFGAMNDIPYYVSGYDYPETQVLALANNGTIVDLNTVFPYSDGTAVNFFENNDFGVSARNKVTTPEGGMYWLPNLYISVFDGRYGVGTNETVAIRLDWLNELNMTVPTSTEEFKAALAAFNSTYGNNVAGDSVYSYRSTTLYDGIGGWFGLVFGLLNVDWAAGQATSPWLQDNFADYITYVNDLYNDGLVDPEMINSNDTLRTKAANNQVGAYTTYALATNYEPLIEAAKTNGVTSACYVGIYPIDAIEGTHALLALEDPVYIWDEFFFTNQCPDPALIAAFLDGYYCDEHLDLINYGVEGHNFTIVDGERQWISYTNYDGQPYDGDQLNQSMQEKADERISYGKLLYIRGGFPDYTYYRLDDASRNCTNVLGWAAPKDQYQQSTLDYGYWTSIDVGGTLATASVEETETYNDKYNDISTASEEAMAKLVVEGNVSDIPAYVATLTGLGLQQLVDIYQARYDRFVG